MTPSLIAAALVATAMLGACSSAAPTGPRSTTAASLELSNSTSVGGSIGLDSPSLTTFCVVPGTTSDTTSGQLSATGTYAVAYGSTGCP